MNNNNNIFITEKIIREIEREYQAVKGLILTESDLKCVIYTKMMKHKHLSFPQSTIEDYIYSHSIHTELSWYDDNGKLTIKPDITLLEPSHLSIINGSGSSLKLPSKQYSFGGKAIILELKFIRHPKGITEKIFTEKIQKDYDKIQRLFNRIESQGIFNHFFCFYIIFNKTNNVCESFEKFIFDHRDSNRERVIYATGNVDMNNVQNNNIGFPERDILDTYGTRQMSFSMAGKNNYRN